MSDDRTVLSYTGARDDVASILRHVPRRCLDIGCSNGALSRTFAEAGADTWGIELDAQFAAEAAKVLGHVLVGDARVQVASLVDQGAEFDTIIAADVLEHTSEPWAIMSYIRRLITPDGQVVISLPNVRFYTTLVWLIIKGRWRYEDRGVHDRTHLRWFTERNARDMFEQAGFVVEDLLIHYRVIDSPSRRNRVAVWIARLVPPLRPFLAYQYVFRLAPRRS